MAFKPGIDLKIRALGSGLCGNLLVEPAAIDTDIPNLGKSVKNSGVSILPHGVGDHGTAARSRADPDIGFASRPEF